MISIRSFEFLAVGIACMWLASCDTPETRERSFDNRVALIAAGEPGNWVPSFLPQSAFEIRVKYQIDTGAELLSFQFVDQETGFLEGHCSKSENVQLPPVGFLDTQWWPVSLYAGFDEKQTIGQYEFFHCKDGYSLAIARSGSVNQAYLWSIRPN